MKESIKVLALAHINRDPRLQMRVAVDKNYVEQLAEVLKAGDEFDGQLPIVYQDGGNNNWMADGFQRFAAHESAGVKKMKCLVRSGTFRDAQQFALSANVRHGARRTNADKKRAVEVALEDEEWSKLSDRLIGELCSVSHTFVSSVRKSPGGNGCHLNEERTGKDGKTYPAENAKKKPDSEHSEGAYSQSDSDADLAAFIAETADEPETVDQADSDDAEFGVIEEKSAKSKKNKDPLAAASEEFCGKVNKLTHQIDGIVRECGELKSDPLGFDTHWDSIIAQLQAARKALHVGRAKFKCPYCKGTGEKDGNGDCKVCKTTGYVGRTKYLSGCRAVGVPPEEDE